MRVGLFFLISCIFSLLPSFSDEKTTLELMEQYYAGEKIPKEEVLDFYHRAKEKIQKDDSEINLIEYIECCTLLSNLYSSGEFSEYQNMVESLGNDIAKEIKSYPSSSSVLMAYADFMYSEFSWKKNVSSNILVLPNIYRKIIVLDKENTGALVKLALWYISASKHSTSNWNSFILSQEKNLDALSSPDRFNGYLLFSMFYMKKYDVEKGMEYLSKAQDLYPQNPLPSFIGMNYQKGMIGW